MTASLAPLPTLEHASVGAPITRGGVSLIPVYLHTAGLDIATGADASVQIGERPDAEVPTIQAANHGDRPALLVDGQVVEGGLQTRVLNVSVLVGAHSSLPIPVSCVEQGRWRGGRNFSYSQTFATRRVRRAKNVTQTDNLMAYGSRTSDQGAVWAAVHHELGRLEAHNSSSTLAAAEARLRDDDRIATATDELRRLGPLPGQCGIIVAHGSRIVSLELFATPAMLAAHWAALVGGIMLDAPLHEPTSRPSLTRALKFVRRINTTKATVNPGVGLGSEVHVRTSKMVAQALVHEGVVVHASAFALAA